MNSKPLLPSPLTGVPVGDGKKGGSDVLDALVVEITAVIDAELDPEIELLVGVVVVADPVRVLELPPVVGRSVSESESESEACRGA